jgi:hypothetical protein
MLLSVAITLDDRCSEPLPAVLDSRSVDEPFTAATRPLAAFFAHMVATFLQLPPTAARRRSAQANVSRCYMDALNTGLIRPERPALDRLV